MTDDTGGYFERNAQAFTAQYRDEAPGFLERREAWARRIAEWASRRPGGLCVDVGCGDGTLGLEARRGGMRLLGIDPSPALLSLARAKAAAAGYLEAVEFRAGSLPLPFGEESEPGADLVLCSSVLEYVAQPEPAIASLARLVGLPGRLLVSLPNREARFRRYERLRRRMSRPGSYLRVQRHQMSRAAAVRSFESHGLRLAEAEYYAAPPFPWLFGSRPGPAVSTMLLLVFDRG